MGHQRRECVGQDMEVFDVTVRRRGRVANQTHQPRAHPEHHAVKPIRVTRTRIKKKLFLPSSVFILNLIRRPNPSWEYCSAPSPLLGLHTRQERIGHLLWFSRTCRLRLPSIVDVPLRFNARVALTSVRRSSALSWRVEKLENTV